MKLRDVAREFVQYRIGNGKNVWVQFDDWHSLGPLVQKMEVCVDSAGWKLPRGISSDLIQVVNLSSSYMPSIDRCDEARWVLSPEFSVKAVWDKLRRRDTAVDWSHLVWHKDSIPRCSFIV